MKFGRTYSMSVQAANFAVIGGQKVGVSAFGHNVSGGVGLNTIKIDYPLTLEFSVERNTLASCNRGIFRVINLKEDTRRQIFKDAYDTGTYRQIILNAGYASEPKLPVIFQGNIVSAYSYRRKQDWVTEITAFDGGYGQQNGQIDLTVPDGYQIKNVLQNVLRTMPNVALGVIGDVGEGNNARGVTVSGNSWSEIVTKLVPDSVAFIDNEKVNIIGKNQYVASDTDPYLIAAQTGLLETPRRFDARLDIKMLFEPRMHVGQLVELQSAERYYNGRYVVLGVRHAGIISGAVGGPLDTTVTTWKGTEKLVAA